MTWAGETTKVENAGEVRISTGSVMLSDELQVPNEATGIVLFAHGSGSSRHSPRNQYVARAIREAGVGTLLFDLLTPEEESADAYTAHLRFDIGLLARRLETDCGSGTLALVCPVNESLVRKSQLTLTRRISLVSVL
jgi:hypothetical protein